MSRSDHTRSSLADARARVLCLGAAVVASWLTSDIAVAQTSLGTSTMLVFPVVAKTASFTGQVTLHNPNAGAITVSLDYFEANNLPSPGPKSCSDVAIPANRSVQFDIATHCTLDSSNHFGLLIVSDVAGTSGFYGYSRTDNTAGAGFSVEGFPVANFSGNTSHATGLKRVATSPTYQTNCFVASLANAVDYEIRLFDDSTGAQIGNTISGSLAAFQQLRYLEIFAVAGAAAGDYVNVRAEFTKTTAGNQTFIGFCTVQDNTSFGADFRIAKSATPAVTTTVSWSGAIGTVVGNLLTYTFTGPTATVNLGGLANVAVYANAGLGRQSGLSIGVMAAVCYQDQSGPGVITPIGTPSLVTASLTTTPFGASGSVNLPTGNYSIGFCELNVGVGPLNNNGDVSGVVVITS